jgi:hypothetical protein
MGITTSKEARFFPMPKSKGIGAILSMRNRYYVQPLTEQVFIIRERMSPNGEPGPNDRIVRSFSIRHDAYMYAGKMNTEDAEQRPLVEKSRS